MSDTNCLPSFLEYLDPQKQKRKNVPFFQLVLVVLMKVAGSIKTMEQDMEPAAQIEVREPEAEYGNHK